MVLGFCLDPMHLIDLGVVRQMVQWFFKKILGNSSKTVMSERLEKLAKYVTKEFPRKPRSMIKEMAHFKAVEYRNIILYFLPVLMLGLPEVAYDEDRYNHMLQLHIAYRMMLTGKIGEKFSDRYIKKIHEALKIFVTGFKALYGNFKLNYNVHNLLHLHLFLKLYGKVYCFYYYELIHKMKRKKC